MYHMVTTAPPQNRDNENAEGSKDERRVASITREEQRAGPKGRGGWALRFDATEPEARRLLTGFECGPYLYKDLSQDLATSC